MQASHLNVEKQVHPTHAQLFVLVQSLNRKGFTLNKCCSELIANCIDAQSEKIIWKLDRKNSCIKLIDIGSGMDLEKLRDLFDIFKSNNSHKQSMGVSGLGGKEAMLQLSKQIGSKETTVYLYTKTIDGDYLKATVPWGKIFEEKKYTGQILFENMNIDEINDFENDRIKENIKYGTTIKFKYNEDFCDQLENQFDFEKRKLLEVNERWDFIFGHTYSTIIYDRTNGKPSVALPSYNYFKDDNLHFYEGKKSDNIYHYIDVDQNDRFVWRGDDNMSYEITRDGRGYSIEPSPIMVPKFWKNIGFYEIKNGMRIDEEKIFDPSNPEKKNTGAVMLNDYDKKFFDLSQGMKGFLQEQLGKISIYRNQQLITKIVLDDTKFNLKSIRGGGDSMFNNFHHRTEISYSTDSTQDNRMDLAIGIQENKNQHQNSLPKPLERLISHIKKKRLEEINSYMDELIDEHEKKIREKQKEKERIRKLAAEEERRKKAEDERVRIQIEESKKKQKLDEDKKKQAELDLLMKEINNESDINEVISDEEDDSSSVTVETGEKMEEEDEKEEEEEEEEEDEEYIIFANRDILQFLNGAFETCREIIAKEPITLATKRNVDRKKLIEQFINQFTNI